MAAYGFVEDLAPLRIQDFSIPTAGYQELSSVIRIHPLHVCVPLPHPDRQIRLLELAPVYSLDPNTAPSLHGRLRIINLQERPKYSALSYVWSQEDPNTSHRENRLTIYCDGHQHEARIGANCWSALWHLSKVHGGLNIWVDSICINQKNAEEKTQQIPLMRVIFGSAQKTYFWLGEAEEGTNEALDYLSTSVLSVSRGTLSDILKAAILLFVRRHTFQVHPHRSALHKIFTRPWIERSWTLQETVLSCDGTVVCGESSVPLEALICALESMHFFRTRTQTLLFEDSYMPWLNLANLTRWFAISDTSHSKREHLPGQSSDRVYELGEKVHRQLRCLRLALRIYFALSFFSYLSFLFALLPMFPLLGKYRTWLVIVLYGSMAFWVAIWIINTIVMAKKRRLGHVFNFDVNSHSIVQELRTRKATDPKDMYFGTLGILHDDSFGAEGSVMTLYKRLCVSLIRITGHLDLLLFANAETENNCPSWVIDWRLETSHFWDKALDWLPSPKPYQVHCSQQDSALMHSEFWISLQHNFRMGSVLYPWHLIQSLIVVDGFRSYKNLSRYKGATPGLKSFWEFRPSIVDVVAQAAFKHGQQRRTGMG